MYDNDLELGDEKAKLYRSVVCTLLYPASRLITAQHGIRELSTELKSPKESSGAWLNRLVRYLTTVRYHGLKFKKQKLGKKATCTVRTDTNWADSKIDRKSVGCLHILYSSHLLYSRVFGIDITTMSSGESEFYGGVSGVADGLHLQDVM